MSQNWSVDIPVPFKRMRRNRASSLVRELVAETRIHKDMFVQPHFVNPGVGISKPISSMPGIDNQTTDILLKQLESDLKLGLNKILLFGHAEWKDEVGSSAYHDNNLVAQTIKEIRKQFGKDILIFTDVCLCSYTTHGHCGELSGEIIDNDKSLTHLVKMSLTHAEAGADFVSPSDMMDGRIGAIRHALDANGFDQTGIMSYAIKFASAYYGPFREAADSAPQFGDRKTYQMDYRNPMEAMTEAELDEMEGADITMVKPGLAYLDIIYRLRQSTNLPIAVYNVSGEYSMVKFAAEKGLIDEQKIVLENLHAFVRAGANILISYHGRDVLKNKWI